ncbi:MAG: asparagine synthase (glutamine-hydrolyzing) [Acidobacteria bacterium]|nr:asparagine synthase (glutamine-hydrolyzing) [Acidobacteriota bacterium]
MCGICGVFEYQSGEPVSPEQLHRMNDTLQHRGPDDEGYYTTAGVGLAMRRLSIIDIAGGHQPISNEDQSIWAVFNGEIYNYQKLREQLLRKGHQLQTRSDTEVILHLYEDHGISFVEHLDGMFALAIYDGRAETSMNGHSLDRPGRLLLARDRLGKKPLYYADLSGALIFGSELKPILQHPRVSKDLDEGALHHYLSLMVVPAPYSIYHGIRKLPAGSMLRCDASGVQIHRYWNYLQFVDRRNVSEQQALAEIRRLLFTAVEKRLEAEVPVGAFLSGGLDSSTVVAIMSRLRPEPVQTFSIGFDGPDTHNELPYARSLAEYYHTSHHEFLVNPNIVQTIEEIVHYADEPFAISSAIPTLLLSKAARQHVTVVLTGDGGDEAFGGYPHYLYERWGEAYRHLPVAADWLLLKSARLLGGGVDQRLGHLRSQIVRFTGHVRSGLGQRRLGWSSGFSETEKERLYAHRNSNVSRLPPTTAFIEKLLQTRAQASAVQSPLGAGAERGGVPLEPVLQQNCVDVLLWLADEMLAKVDRMTMAASVEARCPLVDWRLFEYMAGLPFSLKIPGSRTCNLKHLLRQAVADLLPNDLLQRPKHGFNVPLDAWFRNGARKYLEATLSPERVRRRGLFDCNEVSALMARHQQQQINAGNRLYALLVFETWAQKYL